MTLVQSLDLLTKPSASFVPLPERHSFCHAAWGALNADRVRVGPLLHNGDSVQDQQWPDSLYSLYMLMLRPESLRLGIKRSDMTLSTRGPFSSRRETSLVVGWKICLVQ